MTTVANQDSIDRVLNSDETTFSRFVQEGSEMDFRRLIDRYHVALKRFITQRVRCSSDAEDILQTVYLQVCRAKHTFNPQGSFKAWIFRIAENYIKNYYRAESSRATQSLEEIHGDIPELVFETCVSDCRQQKEKVILERISVLSGKQRETLALRYLRGHSFAAISEITGVSAGAAKSNYCFAVKKVASCPPKLGASKGGAPGLLIDQRVC